MNVGPMRKRLLFGSLIVFALVASACGGDDETDAATPAAPPAEAPAPQSAAEPAAPEPAAPEPPAPEPAPPEPAAPEPAPEPAEEPLKVVLVSNQAAGDQGPVDGMIAGLEASGEARGHEIQFVEATDPAAFETQLRNLAGSGADIIIVTFFDLGSTVDLIAPDYPDTNFVAIVAAPVDQPNANAMIYDFYKGAYIGGRYAAALTDTDQLGYIGGAPLPFAWADYNAFADGARSVNPDIETTATFANGFEDPVGARELASGLYADGVDFIFTGAAAGDLGVVEAAVENDAMVMVSSDLSELGPANVALIVEIEWADTIVSEIDYILSGGEGGRYRRVGPETGEISFAIPDGFLAGAGGDRPARAEAARADLDAAVAALNAGDLVVVEVGEERG